MVPGGDALCITVSSGRLTVATVVRVEVGGEAGC